MFNIPCSNEVNFLVNLYACILDNKNIDAIIQICNFLRVLKPIDYFEIFDDTPPPFKTLEIILESNFKIKLPNVSGISIYEAFEELISSFSIEKSDPFIQTFLDVVKKHSSSLSGSEFIEFWAEKKESLKIASPQKIEAVTLMTIHKSKGLEFPIVLLPFANKRPKRSSWMWLETNKEDIGIKSVLTTYNKKMLDTPFGEQSEQERLKTILDELNVVYVGLTRAADEIYISINEEKDTSAASNSLSCNIRLWR